MTDDFEDSLRETLSNAVPPPPEVHDRAAGARGYARRARRTKAKIAVGAAAVIVATLLVLPSVLASPDTDVAGPGARTPITNTPPESGPACPLDKQQKHTSAGAVRGDAVAARLCIWPPSGPVWSPHEPLVTGLEDLAHTLNALPPATVHGCLPGGSRPVFELIFQYSTGERAVVTGDLSCDYVGIGAAFRDGAAATLQSYLARIADQRQTTGPPAPIASAGSCPLSLGGAPSDQFVVDGRALSLQSTRICVTSNYADGPEMAVGVLSPGESKILNEDFAAHRSRTRPADERVDGCLSARGGGIPTYYITGTNTWGDRVLLSGTCQLFSYTDRAGHWYWVPSPAVATMLETVPQPSGGISGELMAVGGPAGTPSQPFAGSVTLRGSETVTLSAGDDGKFQGQVAPGRYRVTGHSPSYNDGQADCQPMHPFVTVVAHQTTNVTVLCQLK